MAYAKRQQDSVIVKGMCKAVLVINANIGKQLNNRIIGMYIHNSQISTFLVFTISPLITHWDVLLAIVTYSDL